ncbi:MAG TPA: hypothetical protein VIT93_03095 [Dehalococcoidia bacterium]
MTQPGEYSLFVSVVSSEDMATIQYGETTRRGPAESICHEDTCWSVTGSLYITDDELEDPESLTELLLIGFGLEREG